MQNELLKTIAMRVIRSVAQSFQQTAFATVMVDETADVTNVEQVVICLRRVDDTFQVHEEFIILHEVGSTSAKDIFRVVLDVLQRLNLPTGKLRGQGYDGAASMAGIRSGVAKHLQDIEPRAVFTHCYGHSLNLACGDTTRKSKLMKDALDTMHEITKLMKKSPHRDAEFRKLKDQLASDCLGIRVLWPYTVDGACRRPEEHS